MLRESRFLTQDELAQIIGVQAGNLSRWERNESGPYFRHLRALAEYFGVEPASLVEPDDRPIAA